VHSHLALLAALLVFDDSSAASFKVEQVGLVSAVVATATSGRDSPALELSSTGGCISPAGRDTIADSTSKLL
jgi:hypothetical protein